MHCVTICKIAASTDKKCGNESKNRVEQEKSGFYATPFLSALFQKATDKSKRGQGPT